MVAPDDHVAEVSGGLAELGAQLGDGAVVVKAHHRSESLCGNVLGVCAGNQGVGVGRVTHNQHANVVCSVVVEGLTLGAKNLTVGSEEGGAFFASSTGLGADKESCGCAVEGFLCLVGDGDLGHQRKCGVQ